MTANRLEQLLDAHRLSNEAVKSRFRRPVLVVDHARGHRNHQQRCGDYRPCLQKPDTFSPFGCDMRGDADLRAAFGNPAELREDVARRQFIARSFHVDPDDASLYDLAVNTASLGIDGAVDLVVEALRRRA